jgi:hypothetical protein
MVATIGRSRAVLHLGRVKLSGFSAWLLWCFAHIYFLIGFRNRFVVMLNRHADDAGRGAAAHRVPRLQDAARRAADARRHQANDLWHWPTTLVTKDIGAAADRLRKADGQFITPTSCRSRSKRRLNSASRKP